MRIPVEATILTVLLAVATGEARTSPDARCLIASGNAAAKCVNQYAIAVARCRDQADAACEAALRASGGSLDRLLAATDMPTRKACSAESADKLTFLAGLDDLVFRTAEACEKWAEDFLAVAYARNLPALSPAATKCQRNVAKQLGRLHDRTVTAYGRRCYVAEFAGNTCPRMKRDATVARALAAAGAHITKRCGSTFDQLGLSSGATLDERVGALADTVVERARHLAQRVYPPMNLGPTGLFGSYPVGVRTLDLVDPSRPNPVGPGSRPLVTEVYYPSTPAAVAGVPRDVARILDIDLFPTPMYRDVARAPGVFPLIIYSHGGGQFRSDSVIKMAHLVSHGFIVISAEHPGSDLASPCGDPDETVFNNRPLDVRFLIDEFLSFNVEPGNFFAAAIDPARIGGAGWSFGGYAVTALAAGPFFRGTFTDPRLKAILLLDGAMGSQHWGTDAPAIFGTITIPTLSLVGDVLFSIPSAADRQAMFDAVQAGPIVMGYGRLHGASHFTFPDHCETPDAVITSGSIGFYETACQPIRGLVPLECGPQVLPWRYARYITDYLALNFFDATLNGNPEALARLAPAVLAEIEELAYQSK